MRTLALLAVAATSILISSSVQADRQMAKAIKVVATPKGKVLANAKGMSLYIYDKDKTGVSNCNGSCAKKWPPAPATGKSKSGGEFSVIKRKDGSYQWAHKGMPLYTWIKDKKSGDVSGDGFKGVWHLARP